MGVLAKEFDFKVPFECVGRDTVANNVADVGHDAGRCRRRKV